MLEGMLLAWGLRVRKSPLPLASRTKRHAALSRAPRRKYSCLLPIIHFPKR